MDDQKLFDYQPENKSQENWPFNQPFYILINTAVGGNLGGNDIDDGMLPQEFIIDYIRVYEN